MGNILHSFKAYLYPNHLTGASKNDFTARVVSERTLGISDICQASFSRGGSDISAPAMQHAVETFFKEMGYQLCDGYSINIKGYFSAGAQIQGVFNSATDKFDRKRHSLYFSFNQGDTLSTNAEIIDVDVLGLGETGATIGLVTDVKTGAINSQITPNRNLKIAGSKLKLVGDNAEVGVYFINQTTNESTPVDASDIVTNNPSELIIVVPELAAGSYLLEIKTQYAGANQLKEPRSTIFDKELAVQ